MATKKACYWTRKLELDLVAFVKQRPFIWKAVGNTNYDIEKKYKAYAEFAALLDRGFTARSVRDRWVNIRSTFNHYLRKVERSLNEDKLNSKRYVPCWPLWKPLQFLRDSSKIDKGDQYNTYPEDPGPECMDHNVKSELTSENEDLLEIRQSSQRTNRPRRKTRSEIPKREKRDKCKMVLDDLIMSLKPLTELSSPQPESSQSYWFFGKHVTERLNAMSAHNSDSAGWEILRVFDQKTNLAMKW